MQEMHCSTINKFKKYKLSCEIYLVTCDAEFTDDLSFKAELLLGITEQSELIVQHSDKHICYRSVKSCVCVYI